MKEIKIPFIKGKLIWVSGDSSIVTISGELSAKRLRHGMAFNPKLDDLGVIGRKLVTNAGVTFMRDDFVTGATDISGINYHDCGTGGTAEDVADTALQAAFGGARVAGTKTTPAFNQYQSEATITFGGAFSIVEHGLLSSPSGGTLWDRTVFGSIGVGSSDSIKFTYVLTINAGG